MIAVGPYDRAVMLAVRHNWPMTTTMQQDPMFLYHLDAYYVAQNRKPSGKQGRKERRKSKLAALEARMHQIHRGR